MKRKIVFAIMLACSSYATAQHGTTQPPSQLEPPTAAAALRITDKLRSDAGRRLHCLESTRKISESGPANVPPRLSNRESEDFVFVLVSTPPSHGDGVVVEEAP